MTIHASKIKSNPASVDRRAEARAITRQLRGAGRVDGLVRSIHQLRQAVDGTDVTAVREHVSNLRGFIRRGEPITSDRVLSLGGAITFAAIEATIGKTLYDVQLKAGIILCHGAVAEMQTGEGKTLAGLMPAVLHALGGRGVHVASPNDYLAARDHGILRPTLERLGLSAGLLREGSQAEDRANAYACDVTYGPGYAFGFDFLRDQVTVRQSSLAPLGYNLQRRLRGGTDDTLIGGRGQHCAILDEVDHVLIDDAVSPLVLSGASDGEAADAHIHRAALATAATLTAGDHFVNSNDAFTLTPAGIERIYATDESAGDAALLRPWHDYVRLALKAALGLHRDVHYVVSESKVKIVDRSTGRIFEDRSWSEGQHQAIEAKEGVRITPERSALARISRQAYFRRYECLSGMTGTAIGCESELARVYGLPVISVPPRLPSQRKTFPTQFSHDQDEKARHIVGEAAELHRAGRPVLIGTHSIAESQRIAAIFDRKGLPYCLLNGIQDASEAEIISRAGIAGAITIATNMAGRGTDIQIDEVSAKAGGLHVILAEYHSIARVDRQLIGRASRGGDPGSARRHLAPGDAVIAKHAPWIAHQVENALGANRPIHKAIEAQIHRIQRRNEKFAAYQRRALLDQELSDQELLSR